MRRMTLLLLAALLTGGPFCVPGGNPAYAGISIAPAYVDVRLDKGRPSGEFVVTNVGNSEERYRVQSLHFTFSREGGLVKTRPDAHSLAPWLIFNPKELTPAGEDPAEDPVCHRSERPVAPG